MSRSDRRRHPLNSRPLLLLLPSVMLLFLWAVSYGRPWGVSFFSRDGGFYNVSLSGGAVRAQNGLYPRASPSFADVEGVLGWHAVAPHPSFPERPAQSFLGIRSGEFTAPLRHHPFDKSGVHWSNVQFVSVPFAWVVGVFAACAAVVLLPGGRRTIPDARIAAAS